ncbi:hypothetical protein MHIB_34350 [Mycolicibacter hiberniae]|uniref:Uncharacterized protein n=2 Tax=Mycolicibacter hiberniae TaxID=29314 RepID=A0A7I7X821_9MYCO|nr:hypothetical protein MHIB_34350 [Mycolicibacter hiberniae]
MLPPSWPETSPVCAHSRSTLLVQTFTVIISLAALTLGIVAVNRPSSSPAYTEAHRAAALSMLCERYRLAAESVKIETTTPDNAALARIALTNGAVMLETAGADPALDASVRDAVRELALGYQDLTAMGTAGIVNESQFESRMDAVNDKNRVLKEVCRR